MDRLLSGAAGTVEITNYDSSGALANAGTGGSPTAAVLDSAGVAIAGSPFTITPVSTGLYRITIPSTQAVLDTYDVTWTLPDSSTRTSRFEIVGSFLYTISAFRAFDVALANTTTYPSVTVRDIREVVEDRFARAGRVSFTRRGQRDYLDGDGSSVLFTSERRLRSVVSVKVDGTTLDLANLKSYITGKLVLTSGVFNSGTQNVEVLYQHGWEPPPAPVVNAGLVYGRELIVKGAFDDLARATSISTELGLMRISQPGEGRVGVPEIDAVLAEYGWRTPLVA